MFKKSKWESWYDSLPNHTKKYLEKQPVWHDRDLFKVAGIAIIIGFAVGFLFGYESALKPVVDCFRPLIG